MLEMMKTTVAEKNEVISDASKKNLRRKIESDFKTVKFINVDGLLCVYPSNIKLEDVIALYIDTKRELNRVKEISERFTKEKFLIPSQLDLMLHSILQNDQGELQPKGESLKLSFTQNIVYAVTNGRIKTPKNILHPTLIKSLTNNTEIINVINKLGHGVSYTFLMEAHTENAYNTMEQQLENTFILLLDCQKEEYTIYIADNINGKEETLLGNETFVFYFCIPFSYLTTLVSFQPIIFKLQKRY